MRQGFLLLSLALATAANMAASDSAMPVPKEIAVTNNEESSWSPDSKYIAFDSDRIGRHFNIYVLDVASGAIVRLTESNSDDITPAYSPDGRSIAFTSDRSGHNQIYLMNADGKNLRRVTHSDSDDIHPSWSPDGKLIVYCSARDNPNKSAAAEGERYEIYTVHPDGSDEHRLTNFGGINTYPNYSPDGKKIAFRKVLPPKNSEVWVMTADGSDPKNMTNNPAFDGWPFWSPDGSRIVFASNRAGAYDIYTMNADGSSVQRLTDQNARCTSPKWSPDGKRVSFDCSKDRHVGILVIDAQQKTTGQK